MKPISVITILYVILCLSCGQSGMRNAYSPNDSIPKVEFCDLATHKERLVETQFYYSGNNEYWSINNGNAECDSLPHLSFKYDKENESTAKLQKLMENLRNREPYKYHLRIKSLGRYSDEKENNGHLGSLKGLFVISYIIEASIEKR